MKRKYRYLVSYKTEGYNGSIEITTSNKILSFGHLNEIAELIKLKNNFKKIIIQNYILINVRRV